MRIRSPIFAAAAMAFAVVACSVDPAPPVRYYRIEVPAPRGASPFAGRIAVEPFEAYGINNQRPIVFRSAQATSALEQYHYALWAEPPAVTLRDSLITYLRGAFPQAQVVPAGGRARGDLTVRPRLKRLEHVLGAPAQAVFAAEIRVTDADGNERVMLSFDESRAAGGSSVEDLVVALDQLVAKAYAGLAEQMRGALAAAER